MPPSPAPHIYYGNAAYPYAQLPPYGQPQQLGNSMYPPSMAPQYGHPAQHGLGGRMPSCGGQLGGKAYVSQGKPQQYADYGLQQGGFAFGNSPYGASSAANANQLSLPSSLAGMAAGYPPGYAAGGYSGYDGLGNDFHASQGLYMQAPQQGMFPPGHNGL